MWLHELIPIETFKISFETTQNMQYFKGGLHLKPPKFEHIFVAVITFPPFCADTFDISLLLIVRALR